MMSEVLEEVLGVGIWSWALDRAVLGARPMLSNGHTMKNQLSICTTQGTHTDSYNPE